MRGARTYLMKNAWCDMLVSCKKIFQASDGNEGSIVQMCSSLDNNVA